MNLSVVPIPNWLKNKYIVSLIVFAVWMLFIDRNSVIDQIQLRWELRELRKQKKYYKEQISHLVEEEKMLSDPANIELLAREKYYMHRDDEDIFIMKKK